MELQFRIDGLSEDGVRELRKLDRSARLSTASVVVVAAAAAIVYSVATHSFIRAQVVQEQDVTLWQATQAIELARVTNANGEVVLAEAVDKAKAIKQAAVADSPVAFDVTDIQFTAVGGTTAALIRPTRPGVTVQFTVSGTDTYYDSRALQTDTSGRVSFPIPRARSGVIDTISVSAVLSGNTAGTTYTW